MSTVIIEQARVQLDLDQLIRAIQSLDARERQQVREALDRDWAQDFASILREVRARYDAAPMTEDEIAAAKAAAKEDRPEVRERQAEVGEQEQREPREIDQITEAAHHQQNTENTRDKARTIDQIAQREEPQPPENMRDHDAVLIQRQQQ